jgi:hypothetical protein
MKCVETKRKAVIAASFLGQEELRVSDLAVNVFCPLDENYGFGSHQQIGPGENRSWQSLKATKSHWPSSAES